MYLHLMVCLFALLPCISPAQTETNGDSAGGESLRQAAWRMIHAETDSGRTEAGRLFAGKFTSLLMLPASFEYSFDSVPEISVQTPPDKSFHIYTWVIPRADQSSYSYYGIIQCFDRKKKKTAVYPLRDTSSFLVTPGNVKLSGGAWYGASYYKIISSGKRRYTLLGWKGNDRITTKKVIESLYFPGNKPVFGEPVFKFQKETINRIVFEYNASVVMSLKYDDHSCMIVFDHLSPADPRMEGVFSNYGPDFIYDAFTLKKGRWIYIHDIDARNPSSSGPKRRNTDPHPPPVDIIR